MITSALTAATLGDVGDDRNGRRTSRVPIAARAHQAEVDRAYTRPVGRYGWRQVRDRRLVGGDVIAERAAGRRAPHGSSDLTTVQAGRSPRTGRLPSGADRARRGRSGALYPQSA